MLLKKFKMFRPFGVIILTRTEEVHTESIWFDFFWGVEGGVVDAKILTTHISSFSLHSSCTI